MWEYVKAVLYGALEGVTEWLPVSSTGHLILFGDRLMPSAISALGSEFTDMLHVVIQLFAILAVVCRYPRELFPVGNEKKKVFSLWGKLILATLPAALIGLAADALCSHFLGKDLDTLLFTPETVASALIVYGILFILTERFASKKETAEISPRTALGIGFFQALAIVPGTSRSGATILGGRILGISRESAASFSFFAAIPVIGAASLLKLIDFLSLGISIPPEALCLTLTAGAASFAVSMLTMGILTDIVKKHTFIPFGIYRIILGLTVLIFMK